MFLSRVIHNQYPRPDHSSTLKALSPGLHVHVPNCTDMYNSSVLHHIHVPSYYVQVLKLTTQPPQLENIALGREHVSFKLGAESRLVSSKRQYHKPCTTTSMMTQIHGAPVQHCCYV